MAGALFGYFIYSPDPALPQLSGTLTKGGIEVGGLKRTYLTYIPRGLPKGAPLVLVMHGSGEDAAQIRIGTGYGFERLADEHGFAVVYPNSYAFDWNDCSKVGSFRVNGIEVDDVGFLNTVVDKFITEIGIDRSRVFATGVSAGGFMSMRLALEAPTRFRAIAAVVAMVGSGPLGPGWLSPAIGAAGRGLAATRGAVTGAPLPDTVAPFGRVITASPPSAGSTTPPSAARSCQEP